MKLGIVGLGRMGASIALRAINAGHEVIAFDLDAHNVQEAKNFGATVVASAVDVAKNTNIIWLMVPAGKVVDMVIQELLPYLQEGAIVIDGGNSHFTDSIRRAQELAAKNILFLDCGTSGGLHGRTVGFCLMVGGVRAAYDAVYDLFVAIAAPGGIGYMGPSGTGHYVKMVHNGIEYALLEAYAEGYQLIKQGTFKKEDLDLQEITRVWNQGSIIRSWIVDLSHEIFQEDQKLEHISGAIEENKTGAWTVEDAKANNVPVPVIQQSLELRDWSRKTGGNYATKVVAMLRNKFGGHAVTKK